MALIYDFANQLPLKKKSGGSGQPISPPVGEMSGRTEGGNVERPLEWSLDHPGNH
ncbi:hypothetical protein ABFT80_03070 [Mesorhizobium sp. SB112]|uniref:hypothetical protein n=1 Tax=Mesorhizobium sp. SB112 TaxID=3151853 RepID=UPI0032666CBC